MGLLERVDAVFFDVDNTLYPLEADMERALAHLQESHGDLLPSTPGELSDLYWAESRTLFDDVWGWEAFCNDPDGFQVQLFDRILHHLHGDGHDGSHPDGHSLPLTGKELHAHHVAHRFATMSPFPGAMETLEEVARTHTVGIITNGPGALQRRKLQGLGVPEHVPEDLTFVSGEVGHHKPHKRIFQRACEAAGVDPARCLMIGDGLEYDIPAKALGWQAVWFNAVGLEDPASWSDVGYKPDAIARDYAGLRSALGL